MASRTIPKYADGTDSDWLTFPPTVTIGSQEVQVITSDSKINYRKIGNIVQIVFTGIYLKNRSTETNTIIGVIPSDYRPKYNVSTFARGYSSATGNIVLFAGANANGNLLILKPSSLSAIETDLGMNASIFYFVN